MLIAWLTLAAVAAVLLVECVRARRREGAAARRLVEATRSLEALQHAFARFAPAAVVDDIIAGGVSVQPQAKLVTVLFADLQGFTALADRLAPDELVTLLNGWFERMSRAIAGHSGHLAKFLGDGLLALFGALEANPWQTDDAVHAALAMREALAAYNADLRAGGRPTLAHGIGIHRGEVVAGLLGTAELVEYGVVGATVNLASRAEQLTRVHGVDLLLTAAVREALDPRFRLRALPPVEVKGLAAALATWTVEAFAP